MGFGLIIPIQPFLAESFGAGAIQVTWLGASFSLMQFVFAPFWGKLSDRYGRRPILLATIGISALGYALFASAQSLTVLFFARILAGFGAANLGTLQAVIADVTPPEDRSKGMGLIGVAFGFGFIFGPALGGFLSAWGLHMPAVFASGLCVLNGALAYWLVPETRVRGTAPSKLARMRISFDSLRQACSRQSVAVILSTFLLYAAAFSMMEQILGLFIEAHWADEMLAADRAATAARLTAYVLITVGVAAAFTQGLWIGKLTRRFGERRVLTSGLILVSISLAAIPMVAGFPFWMMLMVGVVLAIGSGLVNPSLLSLLSQSTGADDQGEVLGLGQSLSALGRVLGPGVAGLFFTWGSGIPFYVSAAIVVLCFSLSLVLSKTTAPGQVVIQTS